MPQIPDGGERAAGGIPVLAYHQIVPGDSAASCAHLSVSISQFERQMQYLHDCGYSCMSLTEFLDAYCEKRHLSERAVVLTFDDGSGDFFELAYPVLARFGFAATVFPVTSCIGRESDWEGETGTPLMTWDQIKHLCEGGIEFGSHTCTHPRLTRVSADRVWRELLASKKCMEAELHREIRFLAYPYGASNLQIQNIARQCGYQAAFGIERGRRCRFNLWRHVCRGNDTWVSFVLKLTPRYDVWGHFREETQLGQSLRLLKHRLVHQGEP